MTSSRLEFFPRRREKKKSRSQCLLIVENFIVSNCNCKTGSIDVHCKGYQINRQCSNFLDRFCCNGVDYEYRSSIFAIVTCEESAIRTKSKRTQSWLRKFFSCSHNISAVVVGFHYYSGEYIASGGEDSTVRIWKVSTEFRQKGTETHSQRSSRNGIYSQGSFRQYSIIFVCGIWMGGDIERPRGSQLRKFDVNL